MKKTRRRRRRYIKQNNKINAMSILGIVAVMSVVVFFRQVDLEKKNEEYIAREQALTAELEEEQARTKELEEYKKYVQTKQYVEEVAKDKLGLVYENEIIFKPDSE